MTPEVATEQARTVGEVPDFTAKYDATIAQVKRDIALGRQLERYVVDGNARVEPPCQVRGGERGHQRQPMRRGSYS
jgi:hypothetical protein